MINFALIGAGRIGKMHAEIIKANLDSSLKFVYGVNSQLANEVADISNAEVANTPEDAINSSEIDSEIKLKAINGEEITIKKVNGIVYINEAEVVTADVEVSNGVIHYINRVLQPLK